MSDVDELGVRAFGVWDAPVTDDAEWIDVPLERSCMHCLEQFEPGDNGCIYPTDWSTHRECALRAVFGGIGHLVDHDRYCHGELGPDAGMRKRASSILVWEYLTAGVKITSDHLDLLAGREPGA